MPCNDPQPLTRHRGRSQLPAALMAGVSLLALLGGQAVAQVENAGTITTSITLPDGGTVINRRRGVINVGGVFGTAALVIEGRPGTLTNSGLMVASNGDTVRILTDGRIINNSTGTITSRRGSAAYLYGLVTVTNSGLMQSVERALNFVTNGLVVNNAGGTINGTAVGVYGAGFATRVENRGSILGNTAIVALRASYISNERYGVISGGRTGIFSTGVGTLRLLNYGTITATAGLAIDHASAVQIYNSASRGGSPVIYGKTGGIKVASAGNITNDGTIRAGTGSAIDFYGGTVQNTGLITSPSAVLIMRNHATVQNASSGIMQVAGFSRATSAGTTAAIELRASQSTLGNAGRILGPVAVDLRAGGQFTNNAGGTIAGSLAAIRAAGGEATLVNAGRLDAYTGTAVYLGAGGSVTNQVSGVIYGRTGAITSTGTASLSLGNSGAITSGTGAAVSAYRGGLTNSGYLAGLAGAVNFTNGGEITNATGGVLKVRGYSSGQRPGLLSAIEVQGAPASIDNSGTILGPRGIYVRAGGMISNSADGSIGSTYAGVLALAAATTLTNAGSISATEGVAVYFKAGGTVINQSAGSRAASISGSAGAILIKAGTAIITNSSTLSTSSGSSVKIATGTVTNSGVVRGPVGVETGGGGQVRNLGGALIEATSRGVLVTSTPVALYNAGTIRATADVAVYFQNGGEVINRLSPGGIATIYGRTTGVIIRRAAGTITNEGTIHAAFGNGVEMDAGRVSNSGLIQGNSGILFQSGGEVINTAGGTISGIVTGVVANTVTNAGYIRGDSYYGVFMSADGRVTNQRNGADAGRIYGYLRGVVILAGVGNVINDGTIEAPQGAAVYLTSGTVTNTGVISQVVSAYDGSYSTLGIGVEVGSGLGTITNSGLIQATRAVVLGAGGQVSNAAGGRILGLTNGVVVTRGILTLSNSGTIMASGGPGIAAGEASLANSGLIRGQGQGLRISGGMMDNQGGTIEALGATTTADEAAVLFQGGMNGTLTNSGTLVSANGRALRFADMRGDVALVLDTGSSLQGTVGITGAMPATSRLVLQGSGSEDLSRFTGFQNARVESNATWELTSGTGFAGFGTLTNAGTLVPGSLFSPQTLRLEGSFIQTDTGLLRIGLRPGGIIGGLLINGSATLAGDVRFTGPVSGPLVVAGRWVFLQANGGVTGTFARSLNDLAYLEASLDYASDPNAVALVLSLPTPVTPPDESGGSGGSGDSGSGGTSGGGDSSGGTGSSGSGDGSGGSGDSGSGGTSGGGDSSGGTGSSGSGDGSGGSGDSGGGDTSGGGDSSGGTGSSGSGDGSGGSGDSGGGGTSGGGDSSGGTGSSGSGDGSGGSGDSGGGGTSGGGDSSGGTGSSGSGDGSGGSGDSGGGDTSGGGDSSGGTGSSGSGDSSGGTGSSGSGDGGGDTGDTGSGGSSGSGSESSGGGSSESGDGTGSSSGSSSGSGSSGDTPDPTPTDDNRVESETRPITDDEDGDSPAPETNPAPITNPTTGTNAGGAAKGGANRAPGPIDLQRVPFAAVAVTPAQQAAGLALQQLAGEGPLEGFLGDLAGQTLAGARQSLGEVAAAGVARAGEAAVGVQVGRLLLGLPLRALRLEEGGEGADPGLGVALLGGGAPMAGLAADVADVRAWAAGFGSTGAVGDAADAGVEFNAAGGAVGLDQRLGLALRLGLGLGYARSDSQLQALPAGAATDTTALLAYGGWRAGRVHVRGSLGYAHGRVESHRTLSPSTSPSSSGSGPAQAKAGSHTNQLMSRAEAGVDLSLGALSLTPFAALEASQLWQGRTTEDGAAPLNLGLAGGSAASLRHILGAEARHSLTLAEGVEGTVDLRLGWARELHPYASRVSLAFAAAPATGFQVSGPRPQEHAALVGLGLAVQGFQSLSGFARYDAELGHKDQSHSLSLGLRLVW